jgi:hypothetical protein
MVRQTRAIVPVLVLTLVACSGTGESADTSDSAGATDTANTSGATSTSESRPAATSATTVPSLETTVPATEDPEDGIDAASVDACALLTDDEIVSILGEVPEGDNETLGFDASCRWAVVDDEGRERSLSVEFADLGQLAVEEFQNWKEVVTVVDDSVAVGDEAFLAEYGFNGSSLVIRDGGLILFLNANAEGHAETIEQLGPVVLGRIG